MTENESAEFAEFHNGIKAYDDGIYFYDGPHEKSQAFQQGWKYADWKSKNNLA